MKFSTSELIQFAKAALQAHNVPTEDAQITAVSLVQADQRGITSHGLLRLPLYVKAIVAGGINPVPNVKIATPDAATTTIDGDNGLGQVVMRETVNWAAQSAQNHGVSVAAVENSSHYGAGAFWTDRLRLFPHLLHRASRRPLRRMQQDSRHQPLDYCHAISRRSPTDG